VKILQFSTHPTLRPRHGGQLRSHHIGRVLEEAGFDVARLAIGSRPPGHREDPREPLIDVAPTKFWDRPDILAHKACLAIVGDFVSVTAVLDCPEVLAECDHHVSQAGADAILLEHPWSWPIVARLPEVASGRLPVVYSSQNVEAHLKRQIARDTDVAVPPALFAAIDALETDLVTRSAAVAACTEADGAVFAEWGARAVVVVPNGGVRRRRDHLCMVLPAPLEPGQRYALVVGSNHPPNVSGFMELVAPALAALRPGHRIVVAGRMGQGVLAEIDRTGLAGLAPGRLVVLGEVDGITLDAAIANAHAVLLPILYGGGSNVKTAEALLSGRAVVASPTAMRGYDGFDGVPGLTVAGDSPQAFAAAVLAALDRAPEAPDGSHPKLRALLWDETVQPLVRRLRDLGERGAPAAPASLRGEASASP
jgi:glycosyltransferase involved in cell wall biosynthesis